MQFFEIYSIYQISLKKFYSFFDKSIFLKSVLDIFFWPLVDPLLEPPFVLLTLDFCTDLGTKDKFDRPRPLGPRGSVLLPPPRLLEGASDGAADDSFLLGGSLMATNIFWPFISLLSNSSMAFLVEDSFSYSISRGGKTKYLI